MKKLLIVFLLGAASVGAAQVPDDFASHPAVNENLTLRTRIVMLEMALYELQDKVAQQEARIVALEAQSPDTDIQTLYALVAQLQAQDQVLLDEVKVVETIDPGGQ